MVSAKSGYVASSAEDAVRTWLRTQSVLYRDLADGWFRIRHGYDRPDPLMVDNWLVYTLRQGPHQYWYDLALPLTAHYMDEARATAAQVGAPLVAMVIPRDAQVDDARLRHQLSQYHLTRADIDVDKPQRELSALATQLGIPLLDLEPTLRASQQSSGVFFQHDIHFTARGHELAAQALADWVLERIQVDT
jgi:hypothetical protein